MLGVSLVDVSTLPVYHEGGYINDSEIVSADGYNVVEYIPSDDVYAVRFICPNGTLSINGTEYDASDDAKKLGSPKGYSVEVRDVNIYTGAKFIVVYLGDIMTMPGLSKVPNYMNIDIDDNYEIKGLF